MKRDNMGKTGFIQCLAHGEHSVNTGLLLLLLLLLPLLLLPSPPSEHGSIKVGLGTYLQILLNRFDLIFFGPGPMLINAN